MKFTILFLILISAKVSIQTCLINEDAITAVYDFEPLVLHADTLEFVYPLDKHHSNIISVDEDAEILISCAINELETYNELSIDNKTIRAKCNSESEFEVNGTVFIVEEVRCINDYMEVASDTDETCAQGVGIIIDVSYPVEAVDDNVPLYEVCFDKNAKTVIYSKFIWAETAYEGIRFNLRATFPASDAELYYNLTDLDLYFTIYSPPQTKRTVNKLVGLDEDSDKYFPSHFNGEDSIDIKIDGEVLSNNVYFYYLIQQISTGRYINSIPMWDVYHYGTLNNWESLKFGILRFLDASNTELEVYTGTYGVTTLPHEETNEDVEIYLSSDSSEKTFPLAKLLWRVIYNREAKSAIVFVTINNPWVFKDEDKVCEDISSQSGWDNFLTWDKTRVENLYSYACAYEDFKQAVNVAPELDVESILNASQK